MMRKQIYKGALVLITILLSVSDGIGNALPLLFLKSDWHNKATPVFSSTLNDPGPALNNIIFSPAFAIPCTQLTEADLPASGEGSFIKVVDSQPFTFTPAATSFVGIGNDIGNFSGLYALDYNTGDGTEISIKSPAGFSFDLNSFRYVADNNPGANSLTVTLTFINGSTDTKTYPLTGDRAVQTFTGFNPVANDVIGVKLVTNLLIYSNDFCIDDVKAIGTLPLTLQSFSGQATGDGAQLNWQTSGEVNTDKFEIERAGSNLVFAKIYTSKANAAEGKYGFTDPFYAAGETHFYRLKMIDRDGRYTYSPTVQINFEKRSAKQGFHLYPNPVIGNDLFLQSDRMPNSPVRLVIRTMTGNTLIDQQVKPANNLYQLSVSKLAAGNYLLQVYNLKGEMLQVLKMVK